MVPALYVGKDTIYVEFVEENIVINVIKDFAEIYKQDPCIMLVIISYFTVWMYDFQESQYC